ncbi:MAG TPA: 2Fe-2S iron-sulfur cluster-binding protein [Hyphomicrobiaceae bacterium]|jgi:carbon-monoxide dehydrogenase small subunit
MRIALTVNGRAVEAEVAPRTSLADFLREQLLLTGTHLGCEHGICGACTVEIEGEIARSCITYAVVCDGAHVRTIEGFGHDPLMVRLRRAFTEAHALQCGYCTPGMLIASRDLVLRKSGLSRRDIRSEMGGNLCRCTGYQGIVDAIAHVMAKERRQPPGEGASDNTDAGGRGSAPVRWLGPAPGPVAGTRAEPVPRARPEIAALASAPAARPSRAPVRVTVGAVEDTDGAVRIAQSFVLEHPRAAVWALMSDPEAVARCIPGARLDGPPQDGRIAGRIDVRLGPIVAGFAGEGTLTQVPSGYLQRIEGRAADRGSGSRVSGSVEYRLTACTGAEATRVDVVIGYALTGLLAQFGRSALARDLAQSLGDTFAQNLDLRLSAPLGVLPRPAQLQLSALSLLLAALRARLRALLARLLRS